MQLMPKSNAVCAGDAITITPCISLAPALFFAYKAFKRMAVKLYGVVFREGNGGIHVCVDESLGENEFRIAGDTVFASSVEGAGYGLATMLQLIEYHNGVLTLTNVKMQQKPDRDFRGLSVDLARKWHDFSYLLSYVDLCYLNKYRYLQLHLTDDEGWTMPFDCLPNAAIPGACYTKAEIAYLVEYAHEAGIILIPEFEGIGHASTLVRRCAAEFANAYDDEYATKPDQIMCIGKEGVFETIEKMLSELAAIFHYSPYLHIGCDEAGYSRWDHCKLCRKYMADHNIPDSKTLYSHFVKKITDICFSVGKTPIVWEGFPAEGTEDISRDTIVVVWESYYQLAPQLLDAGFRVINASWKPLYITPRESCKWNAAEDGWHIAKWDNWNPKSPAHGGMEVPLSDRVMGGMLCQWECTPQVEREQLLLNLPIVADRTWNTTDYYSAEELRQNCAKLYALQEKLFVV